MKRILAVSLIALGLAGCTPREQQIVAASAVGAVAGAFVVSEMSQPRYVEHRPYYHPRPAYNPYVYHAPRHSRCYIVDRHTPYGIRRERVCR